MSCKECGGETDPLGTSADVPCICHEQASRYANQQCEAQDLPARCVCPDRSGDCAWCQAYYGYLADPSIEDEDK